MRNLVVKATVIGALVFIVMMSAQARDYPFCIKGGDYDSAVGDCSFDTYQQCLASASGRRAYCDANPFYTYTRAPIARPGKPHEQR
jgi:hypothetical protein